MPKYTLQDIRDVARSKDERLENKTKYPDSWIDSKIDSAFETAESGKQVFTSEDALDLAPYISDGVEKFLYETTGVKLNICNETVELIQEAFSKYTKVKK